MRRAEDRAVDVFFQKEKIVGGETGEPSGENQDGRAHMYPEALLRALAFERPEAELRGTVKN